MPFDGNAKFWPKKPKSRKPAFGDDSDELTTADCQQLDTACMKYLRRATSHIRPARLTDKQRELARKNRKAWSEGYTARLGAAERVFAVDQ